MKTNLKELKKFQPCEDGYAFAVKHKGNFVNIWNKCERSDWLIWLLRRYELINKVHSVKIAIACAEPVLKIYEAKHPNDNRPRKAIEAAKAWLENPNDKTLNAAAAYAAAYADDSAAAAASYAAAAAAYADDSAAYAAAAASAASYADYYAYSQELKACRKKQCDIIRSIVPCPFEK